MGGSSQTERGIAPKEADSQETELAVASIHREAEREREMEQGAASGEICQRKKVEQREGSQDMMVVPQEPREGPQGEPQEPGEETMVSPKEPVKETTETIVENQKDSTA